MISNVERAMSAGLDCHIVNPANTESLVRLIDAALHTEAQAREPEPHADLGSLEPEKQVGRTR